MSSHCRIEPYKRLNRRDLSQRCASQVALSTALGQLHSAALLIHGLFHRFVVLSIVDSFHCCIIVSSGWRFDDLRLTTPTTASERESTEAEQEVSRNFHCCMPSHVSLEKMMTRVAIDRIAASTLENSR